MLTVDGALVPTRDHSIAEQSKNYRYSTNHQVVIDAHPPPGHGDRLTPAGRPERPQGMGGIRHEGRRRQDDDHRRRRLSGHRSRHPAPEIARQGTDRVTDRAQPCAQAGPRPSRTRIRSNGDLEDPARLPPQGRRSPPRHARHRPAPQPRPGRVAGQSTARQPLPDPSKKIDYGKVPGACSRSSPRAASDRAAA
ncbi:hypothetical protein KSE_03015 [Kitasatospora setae KM-6054]|uniref:Transposase n=1 Tax=Kitasatospora setae (strain ATCC 33774 / DSM 43861 / JCM 3304 / KCC A-0304 / NBRC 14216 / KM-6054) TaxID=452652 RepID=E4N4L8_KITSK|nr:hypothetical protein KSE_03015 [Kitasatospora setae KM-6054]